MIPALGTIIAAYVCFRMAETFFLASSRYSGKQQHIIVAILALLVIGVTVLSLADIYAAGTRGTDALRGVGR